MILPLSRNSFKVTETAVNTYGISLKIMIMINEISSVFFQFLIRKFWMEISTKCLFFDMKWSIML